MSKTVYRLDVWSGVARRWQKLESYPTLKAAHAAALEILTSDGADVRVCELVTTTTERKGKRLRSPLNRSTI